MYFAKYVTETFSVGLPVEIKNPISASHGQLQQFRVIERFCVESSNNRSDRWALW